MIDAYSSSLAFDMKVCFDGLDFLESPLGEATANPYLAAEIRKRFPKDPSDFDAEAFISSCIASRRRAEPDHAVPTSLRDQYELGIFSTDRDAPDYPYALFDKDWLSLWGAPSVKFIVVPSRDREGKINDIGFRTLDLTQVHNAFKWTFMYGQQATFGLNRATDLQALTLVEGAWDQLAFEQSSVPNTIGLGSPRITNLHKKQLAGTKYCTCWDNDVWGLASRKGQSTKFFIPDAKDPFEAWIQSGSVRLLDVQGMSYTSS